jgi:hypothetical protein
MGFTISKIWACARVGALPQVIRLYYNGIFGWSKKGAADKPLIVVQPGVLQGSMVGKFVSGWGYGTWLL